MTHVYLYDNDYFRYRCVFLVLIFHDSNSSHFFIVPLEISGRHGY